jgi:phage terminase large subunit
MLTVSRPDISKDLLQEFPADGKFLKLPIENYLKLVNSWEDLNRPQVALINAVNSPKYRFIVAAYSRRLGKTYIANIIGQLVTLVPGSNVLIMSPNYNLSSISFELQRKFIKHFDLEVAKDNVKDRIIELENGSTIRMGSIAQVDSCVGRSYNLIIFDEAALTSEGEAAFNVALRPTLDKPNSKAIFISTPRGKQNWFSRFFDRGHDASFDEWICLHADYTENTRMTEKDVAEARKSMSKVEFEQEYMASFNSFQGAIYQLPETNIIEEYPTGGMEIIAGLDPGYRDYTAFIVIGYHYETDKFYVLDEYLNNEVGTKDHAIKIQELSEKWGIDTIFIDSAAAQMAHDLAYEYDIATIKAKKSVLDGIAYCRTIIETDQLYVLSHCTNVIDMLDQYQWDTGATLVKERPKHNEYSHMADALRYCLYSYVR